jgi:signal transduction histidine kinase
MLSMELLADRLPVDEQLSALWTNITTCVEHIGMLGNDIMQYYQMEAGQFQLNYSRCDLGFVIDSAMAVATPIANEKGINFSVESAPQMSLDMDQGAITQVLLNLLTNAIKYTNPGGSVRLRLFDLSCGDYMLPPHHYPPVLTLPSVGIVAEIADTGRGISPEDFGRIFNEFDRIRSDEHDVEGVGLGLAVSQRLVRLHGGEIWFTSAPGQGSTFSFFLPLERRHKAASKQ